MSSEVTLNLRTSVPKMAPQPRAVVVKPAENLAVSLAQIQELFHPDVGGSCSTSVSLQFEPPDAMERLASWLEALRHATKFSDQVAVLDQIFEDGWASTSNVWLALGLFLTFPPSSHLLNRIRKQLTQTSEVDALSRPLVSILTVLARQNESILGPALGRCLESGPITKQIVVAASEQFMPLVLNQILSMNPGVFNQEPQFTSLIRALGQLSSLGNIDPPPKSTLKALADLTRAPETSMDHKLNFCLPVCRWMLLTHDVLITCQSMVADLELDHDPSAEVCFIQAFIVSCRPKMFREQGPKAVDRILVLTKKHPSGPVLLQVSRFAVQFLKRIKAEFTSSSDMEMDLEKCSSQLEDLLWILFESKIESVRHNTCNALAALISILQHKDKQHLDGILRRIVSMNSRSKIRCLALLQVLKALPWTGTLDKLLDESIQNEVTALFEDVHLKKYAIELYEALLVSSHQGSTESPQEWREHWLPPLFQASHEPEIEHLITKVWRLCPDYFDNVNSTHQPTDSDPKSQKIFLLVIKSKKSSNKAKYEDFLDLKVYVHSFLAFNDDVRLLAFESLITSRKGAEPYTKRELEIVLKQSMENMNLETNWAKERYMSLNKKFCCRLSASWDAMVNQMGLDYLSAFVQDLRKIYFQSLFPEANPPRRAMALESIRIVREALSKQFQPARDQFEGSILIKVLGDSFESNKRLALNLLQDFNSDQLSLATSSQVGPIIDKCRIMQRSTNPAHSLEAAYLVLLLSKQCGYKQYLGIEDATQEDVITFTIQRLLRDLTDQLSVARSNLSQAAQTHPMYGVLLNLRMFFEFKLISKSGCFGDELEALFNLMTDIHEVILPVLQSDAPEGVTFETDASSSDAQALLLCAWRTSKEISLLMTSLAKVYLLTNQHEHLCGIFRFLCDSLSVLKHRGAFEQAHLAFATLCQALGGSKRLKSLVDTELAKVLQAISNGESLCSTRRSAGLPFLILSLVSAQGREDRSGTLSSVMQSLFSNAEDPDIPVASRVNALHILRALFRANAFGDDMYTFTEQGLITTISGCNSNLWEIRNASTLMYSTLVTRIFGVKRDKDEFSQKNAITTRMFFQKHPRLFHIFKAMLQNLVECLDKGRGSTWPQESVCVPILVLLAKLKPAPISTGVDQFPMTEYLPVLCQCAGSSIQRVRELSARCLNLFATSPASHLHANWLLDWLRSPNLDLCPSNTTNQLHGRLLIVEYFLRLNGLEYTRDKEQFGRWWLEILWQRFDGFVLLLRHPSFSLRCVVCRIFFHSLELIQFDESTRTPDMLLELNRGLLLQHENLIADPESCRDIAAFHFRSLTVDLFAAIALRFEVNLEDMILMFRFGPESSRMSILRQLGNSQSHFVLSQFIPLLLDSCLSSGSVILEPQHNEFYECILEVINKWLTRVERDNVKNLSSSHLNRLQELVTISINRETMKEQEDEEAEATTARALETEDKSARLMWFSPQLVCLASKLNSWNKINSSAFWDFLLQATSHNGLDTDEQSALAIVQCLQYFHQQTQNPTLLDWQDSLVWYLVLTLCYHNNWNVRNAMCQFYLAMFPLESHSPPSQLGPNFIRRIQCNFGTIGGVLRFLQDLADDHFQEERDDSIFDQSAAQNWRENHLIRSDLKETCMDFILKSDVDLLALQNSAGLCEGLNSKAALLTYFDTSYKSETG
ncbi:thyroid adenoma-associated protein homolog [Tigriopus californicus]|uniref:thyroid adenoma-associated protein homolog n=1 Tax=Tigriopus californicus TaxID=6832 RepID=UPI0027DA32A1|nr:thyroid adenoma-associated protein homolog [Tigriopus californicus]